MINRYEKSIADFVFERKEIHNSVDRISSHLGAWEALVWGRSPKAYRFIRKNWSAVKDSYYSRNRSNNSISESECIGSYYQYFIKSYLSYLHLDMGKGPDRLLTVCHMFTDLCIILEPDNIRLSEISMDVVNRYFNHLDKVYKRKTKETKVAALSSLLGFMEGNGMLVQKVDLINPYKYESSSYLKKKSISRKIPTLTTVNAIAEIYSELMFTNHSNQPIEVSSFDRMACAVTGIIFSAPVRAAELDILAVSSLKEEVVNENELCSLIWRGSKGATDHQKHIHKDMVPVIKKSFEYLTVEGNLARVLCRFYEKPYESLDSVLGKYRPKSLLGYSLKNSVSLWQLASILGIYSRDVISNILNARMRHPLLGKGDTRFGDLCPGFPHVIDSDIKVTPRMAAKLVLGTTTVTGTIEGVFGGALLTLKEVESNWVSYAKSCFENFPYYRIGVEKKQVPLSSSLIITNLGDLRAKPFGTSPFFVSKPPVSNLIATRFSSSAPQLNLFNRFGYDMRIYNFSSHQARHFLNTLGQRGNLSENVIAMWSGRSDVRQNEVYNHEAEEEIDAKFLAIGLVGDNRIIPVTEEQFEEVSGVKFASKTPTGFCIQSLHVNPCTYLQVGDSGCTGCIKHCYIKGDDDALSVLEQDMDVQIARIEHELMEQRHINPIMKKWFDVHISNIEFIHTLITLLKRDDIEHGAIVRFTGGREFRVVISEMSRIINASFQLPESVDRLIRSTEFLSCPEPRQEKLSTAFDLLLDSMSKSSEGIE